LKENRNIFANGAGQLFADLPLEANHPEHKAKAINGDERPARLFPAERVER
jgi:hypothetical protein